MHKVPAFPPCPDAQPHDATAHPTLGRRTPTHPIMETSA